MEELVKAKEYDAFRHKVIAESGGKNCTVDSLLDTLFESDVYVVKYAEDPYEKRTALQRFNLMWFYPLYVVFVAPLMYIKTGHTGLKTDSKLYNLVVKLIGKI
ncbi:hypothetical protein D3C85_946420 [compost metagenome]